MAGKRVKVVLGDYAGRLGDAAGQPRYTYESGFRHQVGDVARTEAGDVVTVVELGSDRSGMCRRIVAVTYPVEHQGSR